MQICGRWWVRNSRGRCPVLIIQNDGKQAQPHGHMCGHYIQMNKAKLPTHVELPTRRCAMIKDSVILLEQLRTDKQRD